MRILSFAVVATFMLTSAVAQTETPPQAMQSIVINSDQEPQSLLSEGVGVDEAPLSAQERAYWECVLEHSQHQESDEALNVMLAACRALHGIKSSRR